MITVRVQAESAMTLVAESVEKEEGYKGIHVTDFVFRQLQKTEYDIRFKLTHFDENMKFYITKEQEHYEESDLVSYIIENGEYFFYLIF